MLELGFHREVDSANRRNTRNLVLSLVGGFLGGLLPTYIAFKTVFPAPDFKVVGAAPVEIIEQQPEGLQIVLKITVLNVGNSSGAFTNIPVSLSSSGGSALSAPSTSLPLALIQMADSNTSARFPISVGANGNSDLLVTLEVPRDSVGTFESPGKFALTFRVEDYQKSTINLCFELAKKDVDTLKVKGNLALAQLSTTCPKELLR